MSDASTGRVFDPLLDLLDQVLATLGKVGIELPALAVQVFLLVLMLTALYPIARAALRREKLSLTAPAAVALGLGVLGLAYGLLDQALLPNYVSGIVAAPRAADVRVQLLDHQGRIVTSGEGRIDTQTGEFALYYRPWLDGRARGVLITGCGKGDVKIELPRAYLRAGAESRRTYACGS
jgi:hypothetical protein